MRMRKKGFPVIAAGLSLLLMFLVSEPVHATNISDLERERQELEQQAEDAKDKRNQDQQRLDEVSGRIDSIQGDADEVAEEIDEIDAALVETLAAVELIEEEIDDKEEQIVQTTADYETAQEIERQQYEAMKLRIQFMYEKGDQTYLQLLLGSQSFGEMVNKADYIQQLYDYDREMLEKYQLARQETEDLKSRLEEEMAELEAQQHELSEEQESLSAMLEEKQTIYDNYEVQIARAKQEAAIYKSNIKKQAEEIRKLEAAASAKQSEIDKAKQAEEEAKKAQEEALKKQNESGGSDGGGSTASSGNSYASASSYSGSGSKGQQIANYACQFIGNPYVPGGTSLTQGADCSGFVWRVYKDFGYTVPRTSYGCRSAGRGVSYAEAQPGDIICYAGHVGLYIGNGQIVHASTQKTGIKITNATYKEILTVRRIV